VSQHGLRLTSNQIRRVAECCTRKPTQKKLLKQVCTAWLEFLGTLRKQPILQRYSKLVDGFANYLKNERGHNTESVRMRVRVAGIFLRWYARRKKRITALNLSDIDRFLGWSRKNNWSRKTINSYVSSLKAFIRYGGARGWCKASIADGFRGPVIYSNEKLPLGPSWDDVKRLIQSTASDDPRDIRDRPILMLLAIYGFRAEEVAGLGLENINWENEEITLTRQKSRKVQKYPLLPLVGDAIIRYLREVRPPTDCRVSPSARDPPGSHGRLPK